MKDYTTNERNSASFILNYKIVDGKIIVNLANKQKETIEYTPENELKVLNKMKEQVLEAEAFEAHADKEISSELPPFIHNVLYLAMVCYLLDKVNTKDWLEITCVSVIAMSGTLNAYEILKNKIKLYDLNKNRFFLENEELINSDADNINNKSNEIYTLNSVDKISYRKLKKLVKKTN